MAKATHKQMVGTYKGMGYQAQDEFPAANVTILSKPNVIMAIKGSQRIDLCMDGNKWCATKPDFTNLQECDAGFGATIFEAIENLFKELTKTPDNGPECPYCESKSYKICRHGTPSTHLYIECGECKASGPMIELPERTNGVFLPSAMERCEELTKEALWGASISCWGEQHASI